MFDSHHTSTAVALIAAACFSACIPIVGEIGDPDPETTADESFGYVIVDGERFGIDNVYEAQVLDVGGSGALVVGVTGQANLEGIAVALGLVDTAPLQEGASYPIEAGTDVGAEIAVGIARLTGEQEYCAGDSDAKDECVVENQGDVTVVEWDEGAGSLSVRWDVRLVEVTDDTPGRVVNSTAELTVPVSQP